MATVVADMSMTLDGFVADPQDGVEHVFAWCTRGPVTVPVPGGGRDFRVSEASAADLREAFTEVGAVVCGRRLFDLAHGWGGRHPVDAPVFVVTHTVPDDWAHPDAPFTFVTDGVESAVAQAAAVAGDRTVAVATADLTRQCLDAGLLDAIRVSLVPVLLGEGIRFFDGLRDTPVVLEDPRVTEGLGVTHLHYRLAGR